jgi:hypothetical protein
MMSVPVRTAPTLTVGTAQPLFELKRGMTFLDVSRDGRFLVQVEQVSAAQQPITVSTAGVALAD